MLSLAAASCRNEAPVVQKTNSQEASTNEPSKETSTAKRLPTFSADSALLYIRQQCDFGARVPNTEAHEKCADYLKSKLTQFGAEVQMQKFEATAFDGTKIKGTNIIGSIYPEKGTRIALFSHWDSRPFSDQDDEKYFHTPVMGANDGASGVGVILELARLMQSQTPNVGVDIVFLDAEDCGNAHGDEESWCLGSQYWSLNTQLPKKPTYGILLDMVGGDNPFFGVDNTSAQYALNVVNKVWSVANSLGYSKYFLNRTTTQMIDDHVFINRDAKIPTIDILDFSPTRGFPQVWHTHNDTPENISKRTLEMVGNTLTNVIYRE